MVRVLADDKVVDESEKLSVGKSSRNSKQSKQSKNSKRSSRSSQSARRRRLQQHKHCLCGLRWRMGVLIITILKCITLFFEFNLLTYLMMAQGKLPVEFFNTT